MTHVLVVDDDSEFLLATQQILKILGHNTHTAESLEEARRKLANNVYDHILLDLLLPDGSGLHLLKELEDNNVESKATLVTGHSIVQDLMGSLDHQKYSYLVKPIDLEKLKALLSCNTAQNQPPSAHKHFGCLIGETPVMQELYQSVQRISKTPANVLLMGESGTGKEVFAKAIHNASAVEGEFVAVNCGAFAKELIASELFGHEKGAFTGAHSRKIGVFERARGGTLFLDEITEMPLEEQANLLRALESMQITRLGGDTPIELDCRIISATNRSETELAMGHCLREDLYYRIAVFPIKLPTLRERKPDIPLLTQAFLHILNQEHSAQTYIKEEDMKQLMAYDWPGNVRELRHAIHRAFILADSAQSPVVLPKQLASPFSTQNTRGKSTALYGRTIEDVEKELILTTLDQLNDDKQKAAKILGISLKTLYNRLNSYKEEEAQ